jgi:predicted nucleic-acid-binding Zn-ribbon protein
MVAHRCKKCFYYDIETIDYLNEIQWEYDARKKLFGYGDQEIKTLCPKCGNINIEKVKIKPKHPETPEDLLLKIDKHGLNVYLV